MNNKSWHYFKDKIKDIKNDVNKIMCLKQFFNSCLDVIGVLVSLFEGQNA